VRTPLLVAVLAAAACSSPPALAPRDAAQADGAAPDLAQPDGAAADLALSAPDAAVAPPDLAAAMSPSDAASGARDGGYGTAKGTVKLTYYWVTYESDYTGANDTILCDGSANTLAVVPLAFANALRIEGTGRLTDGRLLNVGSSCACPSGMTVCYYVPDPATYPWGVGAGSRALKPYRSIAVDKTFITLGHKVYVPELDGVQMPASYGFVHDGCLEADDVGGGITGAHIDFFVAQKANYLTLDGMLKLSSVTAFVDPPRCP
jgi:3D (Asp-Asp-Asp) domain-containing protein